MNAQNLLNYLLELKTEGQDLKSITLNFRSTMDSDIESITYCGEDLFCEKDNSTLKSLIFINDLED
jgi:uncharacterized protein YjiK